jgi:hypothetical protein
MRRGTLALLIVPSLLLVGCGRSLGSRTSALPSASATQRSSCRPSPQPPVPARLTDHSEKIGDGILDPVDPGVQPAIAAGPAWAAAQVKPSKNGCEVAEILGYYSASAPATIAAGCGQPPLDLNDPACTRSTPNYRHRLVWMITWTGTDDCVPDMGPGPPPPGVSPRPAAPVQSRSCLWWEPIDASTGKYDFAGSIG